MALPISRKWRIPLPAWRVIAALALAGILMVPLLVRAQSTALIKFPLDGDWQFRQVGQEVWHPGRVPGCVHLDLMADGLIPAPFYRDNELRVQWVEKEDWEYRKEFVVAFCLASKAHVELGA